MGGHRDTGAVPPTTGAPLPSCPTTELSTGVPQDLHLASQQRMREGDWRGTGSGHPCMVAVVSHRGNLISSTINSASKCQDEFEKKQYIW